MEQNIEGRVSRLTHVWLRPWKFLKMILRDFKYDRALYVYFVY